MRVLALVLLLVACHREVIKDEKVQAEEQDKTAKTDEEKTVETKHQDPVDVDFKITREDNALVVQAPDGAISVTPVAKGRPTVLPKGSKVIGTVALTETTRDESKHIGAKDQEKTQEKKSSEVDDVKKKQTGSTLTTDKLDVGPGWKLYIYMAVALVILLVAVYCYAKFIKKGMMP